MMVYANIFFCIYGMISFTGTMLAIILMCLTAPTIEEDFSDEYIEYGVSEIDEIED